MSDPVTTKFANQGAITWPWPANEFVAEVEVWGGGAGGENAPADRGAAGGPGGGYHRVLVVKQPAATNLQGYVGAGGSAGQAGEESYVKQLNVDLARAQGGGTPTQEGGQPGHGYPNLPGTEISTYGGTGGRQGAPGGQFTPPIPPDDFGHGGGGSGGQNLNCPPAGMTQEPSFVTGGGKGGQGGAANQTGNDAPERGGGGGGGGKGRASGKGHAGAIWITCPPSAGVGGRCCCTCRLEDLVFPDQLKVDLTASDIDQQVGYAAGRVVGCAPGGGIGSGDPSCGYGGEVIINGALARCCPQSVPIYRPNFPDGSSCYTAPYPPGCPPGVTDPECPRIGSFDLIYNPAVLAGLRSGFGRPLEYVKDPIKSGLGPPPVNGTACCNLVYAIPGSVKLTLGCVGDKDGVPFDNRHDVVYDFAALTAGLPAVSSGTQPLSYTKMSDDATANCYPNYTVCHIPGLTWDVRAASGLVSAVLRMSICPNGSYTVRYDVSYSYILDADTIDSRKIGDLQANPSTTVTTQSCRTLQSFAAITLQAAGTIGATDWNGDKLKQILLTSTDTNGLVGVNVCSRLITPPNVSAQGFNRFLYGNPAGLLGYCTLDDGCAVSAHLGHVDNTGYYAAWGPATARISDG